MNDSWQLQKYISNDMQVLKDRVKKLETLIPAVKQSIRAVTIPEANDSQLALINALMKVEPEYFISMNEWLANPAFDSPESD